MATLPQRIVILTGAGISAESGLGTFRDKDGLWTKVRLEDVATPEGFARDPDYVLDFHNERRLIVRDAVPNAAHHALARLEQFWPGEVLVVTQNVDGLHEKAGTRNLIHMHGETGKVRCNICADVRPWDEDITTGLHCPNCGTVGQLRPDVVWFGEIPYHMERIHDALAACDLFVSIGTSGVVYPAAGFVAQVRMKKRAHTVELNLEPSDGASMFAEQVNGPASRIVPEFVDRLIERLS
ncbi:NAD-dependent deacylase [Zavarzinia sp. CC-PAN008]|uniref:NAD-dependent deacylase n=1 Tax=Zavarzinia sp. CC-PAN008 TaxID=3243332 RepID=UPI003F74485D